MSAGKIGVPELLVGVPFPAVAIEILRFACGRQAQWLAYSGRTVPPEEAVLAGMIDEVIAPDFLHTRAEVVARELAAIDGRNFALTKKQLRAASIAQMKETSALDKEAVRLWSAPEVHEHIRDYLARTIRK